MKKRLILLLIILIQSLPSFSQNVTRTYTDTQNILLPVQVARQVAKDLVRGDSCFAELKLANEQIAELEKKILLQQGMIDTYVQIESNLTQIIKDEREKNKIFQYELDVVSKELKKEKTKRKFGKIIYSVIIGGLTYLYITK